MLQFETLRAITGLLITSNEKQPLRRVSRKILERSSSDSLLYSVASVVIRGHRSTTLNSLTGFDEFGAF